MVFIIKCLSQILDFELALGNDGGDVESCLLLDFLDFCIQSVIVARKSSAVLSLHWLYEVVDTIGLIQLTPDLGRVSFELREGCKDLLEAQVDDAIRVWAELVIEVYLPKKLLLVPKTTPDPFLVYGLYTLNLLVDEL